MLRALKTLNSAVASLGLLAEIAGRNTPEINELLRKVVNMPVYRCNDRQSRKRLLRKDSVKAQRVLGLDVAPERRLCFGERKSEVLVRFFVSTQG